MRACRRRSLSELAGRLSTADVIVGGEALSRRLRLDDVVARLAVINTYGPTETTVLRDA